VMLFVLVTATIESFKTFEQVQIMTRGDPLHSTTTVVHQIYLRGFGEYKMGYAAAMSAILLAILMLITALQFRIGSREVSE
ncbi:MAG: sugar ABC transporter permease, partial [Clostridia bacterium]|nr:sugar ABC transporter permease [Clostridia bacterium]